MQNWGLDFAMSVTFLGMVVPYLKTRPMLVAVLVSAVLAVASHDLPHKLGLLLSAFSGIAVGLSLMMFRKPQKQTAGISMNETFLIAGMFAVTFSVRYILFAMAGKVKFPPWLNRALEICATGSTDGDYRSPMSLCPRESYGLAHSTPG